MTQLFDLSGNWTNESTNLSFQIENLIHDWIINNYQDKDFRHLSSIVLESAFSATLRARATIARNKGK